MKFTQNSAGHHKNMKNGTAFSWFHATSLNGGAME